MENVLLKITSLKAEIEMLEKAIKENDRNELMEHCDSGTLQYEVKQIIKLLEAELYH